MTAPVRPQLPGADEFGTPNLTRVLSPDEFQQARTLTPAGLRNANFPVVPPQFAPKDAVQTSNPNAQPDKGTPLSGFGRILTKYVAAPLMDHPLTTVATTIVPGAGLLMSGLMGKDILEYSAQKYHEMQMSPEDRAKAEASPTRIPGERAAVEAAMLGVAPLIHAGVNAMGGKAVGLPSDLELATAGPNERFSGLPLTTEMRTAIGGHVDNITDALNTVVAPASRTAEAGQAAGILRATTGHMAANYEQAAFKLDEFRRAIEPLPDADKLGFIDAVEGGRSQASPEFQKASDTIREILDTGRDQIRALGTGKLEHFITDYFPHIWTDPERAADVFGAETVEPTDPAAVATPADTPAASDPAALQQAKVIAGSKRPMEGSKAFLKQRTIPTTLEGIQAGLQPVSMNPVDLTLLKLREMQRYLMAHQSLHEMQDAGLVKYVRSSDIPPDGYARIDDKIATVFGPKQGAVNLPEGANIAPEDVGVPGLRIMGQYHAPEPVAKIVNNYLSPGLRGNAIYDAYRGIGNTLNQAQLGFSAFHLGMTSLDATVSRTALGLEHIASGNYGQGAAMLAKAPAAPFPALAQGLVGDLVNRLVGSDLKVGLGAKIRDAYLSPENASPEMQALANAVKEAGGRITQDSFYKNSAAEKMIDAWRAGGVLGKSKAAAYSLPALLEMTTKPIMEHVVPLQKLQVFGEMAQKAMADLPDEATLAERRAAYAKAWDSTDNRMGQLVYDNLFWNKTFKDLAMASTRSVGWNLGTIRELGGGITDLAKAPARLASGEKVADVLTHKAAYALSLPMTVGLYGALYQYLRTGEGPSELKDYMYPKTGEVDADGNAERVQLPSYMKDMMAYAGSPWQTVKHKVAPLPNMIVEMLQNEDYYGDEVRNPNDPVMQQLAQEAKFVGGQVVPFSYRNAQETAARGDQSNATKFGNWFGITPAPRKAVRSDAQNLLADFGKHAPGGASPEDAAARRDRSAILQSFRLGQDATDQVNHALERGTLTPPDIAKLLKRAGMTPAQEKFKRLTLDQAVQVFQKGTPREQALFAESLMAKIQRAEKAGAKE